MNTDAIVREVLESQWELETEIVGETVTNAIVAGDPEIITTERGENLDLTTVIAELVVATTLIHNILKIYKSVKDISKKEPSKEEIENQLDTESKKIDSDKISDVIDLILDLVKT